MSPDLISEVTDGVLAEVLAWRTRSLEPMYRVVFFDALRVKIRDESVVQQSPHFERFSVQDLKRFSLQDLKRIIAVASDFSCGTRWLHAVARYVLFEAVY